MSSSDIAEFLSARLDEDERTARDATPDEWIVTRDPLGVHVENGDGRGRVVMCSGDDRHDGNGAQNATHIARHDPARVRREVEAGRSLLARYRGSAIHLEANGATMPDAQLQAAMAAQGAQRAAIRDRVAVWSDHPDYRPEWKP